MTTIQIDIDEVPVRIGKKGLELAEAIDKQGFGYINFSVDVEIQPCGHWDITDVFPAIDWKREGDKMVTIRGDKATGQFAIEAAKFLEEFAEEQINDDVHETLMQADRSEFPGARVA